MASLKQFRKKHGLTQNELAQKVGTTPTTISKYEKGEWRMNQAVIDAIKAEYGEDVSAVQRRTHAVKKAWVKKNAAIGGENK